VKALPTRTLLPLALLLAVVALTACGNKEDVVTRAKTEGIYVDAGPLAYQVQISRILNPALPDDAAYLAGAQDTLDPSKEAWFAVFIRVENDSRRPHEAAKDLSIADTQDDVFTPVAFDDVNPFVYRPAAVPPKGNQVGVIPDRSSVAGAGPIAGAMVLFKIPYASLQNRPLELRIKSPEGESASVDLDV